MALMKQVVSAHTGTVTDVPMSPAEEAAFMAESAANAILSAEALVRRGKEAEARVLHDKLLEARLTSDPVLAGDILRYRQLKAELAPA